MASGNLKIHSENLMPIIKKWLYSDKDIFIRELVSNGCDALAKVKMLSERDGVSLQGDLRLDITIDEAGKTLKFSDTGIGMDGPEVEKYIAQIAFSGAEEFLNKYSSSNEKDQIIGHFGLGFYSAYMVADLVEIETKSYKEEALPVRWTSDGQATYELTGGSRENRGTDVILHINEENSEFLQKSRIQEILNRYCAFLPFPIYLNGEHINSHEPLWIKAPSECSDKDYLSFFRKLYPFEPEPLFWVHLNIDFPFHLKGILYFPKLHPGLEPKKNNIKLFCNRVFVSEQCQDLLPDYLTVLKGALDSPDIPLNVSRSYLQMDRTVRQLGVHISKKVAEKLLSLFKSDREAYLKVWPDIELIVKLGVIQDEKFYDKVKECLLWKNSAGEWTTIGEYVQRHEDKHADKIFYTSDEKHPSHFLELYRSQGFEVLYTTTLLDSALIQTIESKDVKAKFQRIDSAIDQVILDASKEKVLLDAEGKTMAVRMADMVRAAVGSESVKVEAKSLASETLPGFIMIDEQSRRMRDYLALSQSDRKALLPLNEKTFVVNTNSRLMNGVYGISLKDPGLAKELIQEIYDMALLSHKELDATDLSAFIARSYRVMEHLVVKQDSVVVP